MQREERKRGREIQTESYHGANVQELESESLLWSIEGSINVTIIRCLIHHIPWSFEIPIMVKDQS